MTYKIGSQAKAWWPIRFNGVTEDGEVVVNEIRGRFLILDEDENFNLDREIAAVRVADDDGNVSLSELMAPLVLRFLEDWKDVVEDDGTEGGKAVPFTEASLKRMLRVPNFANGVADAYRAARKAEPERRKGN